MKRSQMPSPSAIDSPQHKKLKGEPLGTPMISLEQQNDGWTKVEKRKHKKDKKIEAQNEPRFMYNQSEIIRRQNAIGIGEIRDLTLHIIADAPPPNWLKIENAERIPKVVVLLIPGITPDMLCLPPLPTSATANPNLPLSIPLPAIQTGSVTTTLPFIASTFSHGCPTRAPGDHTRMHSVISEFCSGPVSHAEKKRRLEMKEVSERTHGKDPMQYLLTLEQMIENDYPIPSYMADVFEKPEGWVETPELPKSSLLALTPEKSLPQKIYAIDCEMCLTEDGKELTRVCLIDFHSGKVLFDQLVKPAKPILDYLTRWSGITAEALFPIKTTLADVQTQLLRYLSPPPPNPFAASSPTSPPPPTPILLGHSLESDLKALKLCHPRCIDTAVAYHHPRGRPLKPGLAWLTNKWCGREIQARGEGGHDPEEDARACIDLLQKKIEYGPSYGEFKIDFESIFERMAKATRRLDKGTVRSIKTAVVDHGNPSAMHGSKASTSIGCESDEEVLKALLETIPSHDFVFARFTKLADVQGWITPRQTSDGPLLKPVTSATPDALSDALKLLNTSIKAIHAALPTRTAFIIFTGHSDPRKMAALNARKNLFEQAIRSGRPSDSLSADERWTTNHVRELEHSVDTAKRGLLFLGVKA